MVQQVSRVHLVSKTHLDLGFTALASEVEQRYLREYFPAAISTAKELRARSTGSGFVSGRGSGSEPGSAPVPGSPGSGSDSGPGSGRFVWTTGSWILHRALADEDRDRARAVEEAIKRGDLAWHGLPLTFHTELMDADLVRSALGISQELDTRFGTTTTAAKMTDVPGHTRGLVPLLAEAGVRFLHIGVNPAWPVPDVPPIFRWRWVGGPESRKRPSLPGEPGVVWVNRKSNYARFEREHRFSELDMADSGGLQGQKRSANALEGKWGGAVSGAAGARDSVEAVGLLKPGEAGNLEPGDAGYCEVIVAYQAGGYGGDVVVEGCSEVLAFLHSGDNLGPPSAQEVIEAHRVLSERYPGAVIEASTLDRFAEALLTSGAVAYLPVVTSEIGDPWLFGAGSDPQKLAAFREQLRAERSLEDDRRLMLVAEHTWGLDQKEAWPDTETWGGLPLIKARNTPQVQRFEQSWAEQRALVGLGPQESEREGDMEGTGLAGTGLVTPESQGSGRVTPELRNRSRLEGVRPVQAGEVVRVGEWAVAVAATGALGHLVHEPSGRVLAGPGSYLGTLSHQRFSAEDYERFYAQLTPSPPDQWWARWDNTKPGLENTDAKSEVAVAELMGLECGDNEIVARVEFPAGHVASGAPPSAWLRWGFGESVRCELSWPDKPASRMPEATWMSFMPVVAEPDSWLLDKLGQWVSPLDVVRRGGRSLHSVGRGGATNAGPDGTLTITTADAGLIAPGRPNLLDADPPLPDLGGGLHVLLHGNCWGTNFPMWNEGPGRFRFELVVTA
ncbi:MAG: DUF5054 domain-containing protein [Acidimicrobiales bacterium]|nr:DUF5054 domain-containing protein [Acidimicrobiales bacterium]